MSSTRSAEAFQIPIEVAEQYEAAFVPAFFAQWAPMLVDATGVTEGSSVLDVGCGTGIVARTAADRVGLDGVVVGVDVNEAMLTVARRVRPDLDWRSGDAAALPVESGSFDVVVSQMALMFVPDITRSLAEMRRVAAPGGTVGLLVPGRLGAQAAFAPFVDMVCRHAGDDSRSLLTSYFRCGDLDRLGTEIEASGADVTQSREVSGHYRAPSVLAFVATEVDSTPLAQRLDPTTRERIERDASDVLAPFVTSDGGVDAPFVSNLVVARP